ncbi:peptide transporter family 1-like [Culicoides brevitarsis]|uniref:peptide transporter family 1-like n=1 Tax=Culicoides brevitarsis TaxID=469753 RepID=UPI00307C8D5E
MGASDNKHDTDSNKDNESQKAKLPYPRSIPFIIANEFCERFNFYGMRTILALYLTQKLSFSEDTATVIFHLFTTMVYFMCIFGAIIADSWLGKFKTILYLSIVYVTGSCFLTVGAIDPWNMPQRTFTFIGLALIALGSGGIKPCVSSFGGDQFKIPEQAKQLAWFFSLFYFSVNSGSFVSTLLTPILRDDVSCFGNEDCFSLGFFVPAALMAISIVIFVAGSFLYIHKPGGGNMMVKVSKCVWSGIRGKMKNGKTNPKAHWLDHAVDNYGQQLVDETKILLNVLLLYIPLPIFWTLFDQQGSRWTFQATRMDGDLGFYTIKPDQAQVINPLLILVFIPLYEMIFYPLLNLVGIRRPLQKLVMGGVLAGVAFFVSFLLEMQIMKSYAVVPQSGEAQLRVFNTMNCDYNLAVNGSQSILVKSLEKWENLDYTGVENAQLRYTMTSKTTDCPNFSGNFEIKSAEATSYFMHGTGNAAKVQKYVDDPEKTSNGNAKVRFLANTATKVSLREKGVVKLERESGNSTIGEVSNGEYELFVGESKQGEAFALKIGGVYTIAVNKVGSKTDFEIFEITQPNGVNMLWIIPQYVVMTLGEVMYSVTGLQFSFNEAPQSMKSVLTGCWMLTIAVGNLIIVFIAEAKMFNEQLWEFLMFAILMWVDMALFAILAWRYKSIPIKSDEDYERERLEMEEKEHGLEKIPVKMGENDTNEE